MDLDKFVLNLNHKKIDVERSEYKVINSIINYFSNIGLI